MTNKDNTEIAEEATPKKGRRPPRELPASAAAAAEQLESRKFRHLTATEWETIRVIWETGNTTLAELAKRFRVSPETISRKMKRLGIKKGAESKRYVSQVRERMHTKINGTADEIAERIKETKDNYLKWNDALSRLTMKEIAGAKAAGKPMASISGDIRTYEIASNILAKNRAEQYKILGLDDDDGGQKDLPDLLISEMTAEEVEQVRNKIAEDDLMEASEELITEGFDDDFDDDDDFDEAERYESVD